jgi:dihydroxy-acid dehydratase
MCGFCVDHAELEAAVDGPFELVRDGAIETDVIKETIQVGDAELEKRKKDWRPHKTNFGSGALWGYARTGAVTHPGASSETNAYADA